MGFSRQEYWSGLPFPSPGDLPNPGIESRSNALQADSLPTELWGKSIFSSYTSLNYWSMRRSMGSIRGHTHGIKTLEFESDSTQRLPLLDLGWVVYPLPGFWGTESNKWIFHCARSTPLTPSWFRGQLYLPFHLWIGHQSALTPSIVASADLPHIASLCICCRP